MSRQAGRGGGSWSVLLRASMAEARSSAITAMTCGSWIMYARW
ncbi:hypothetical protein [Kitasatospora sp. NBC_01302]|nr:hypothetical protein OG294_36130 [Kitasatospora sp. NBC_01302]